MNGMVANTVEELYSVQLIVLPNLIFTFTVTPVDAKVSPTSHATADESSVISH